MLLWLLRGCYIALMFGSAVYAYDQVNANGTNFWRALGVGLGVLAGGGLILFTDIYEKQKSITTISAVYFGLLLGLLLGWLFSLVLETYLEPRAVPVARFIVTLVCCYMTISTLLQTKDEFRFIIPYVEFAREVKGGKPLVLDTSVIIDGRIADVCETPILLGNKLIVPKFVLNELQSIADSSDKLKRNRGRRGLDILKRMQSNESVDLERHQGAGAKEERGRVDERLVAFASSVNGRVVTNDFNLNKIAQLQGVEVINLNEVANSLKTVALPGEVLHVKIVKAGDQVGQGVGYLEDGTMVVVEQGRAHIGQQKAIVVTSVLQTPAGRMIFAKVEGEGSGPHTAVNPQKERHSDDKSSKSAK